MPPSVDLVVACEMLYYVDDIPRMIKRLSQLGRACLVTYHHGQAKQLDHHFSSLANHTREQFRFGDTEWNAVWWRNSDRCGLSVDHANGISQALPWECRPATNR
jgi:hypothetical protein